MFGRIVCHLGSTVEDSVQIASTDTSQSPVLALKGFLDRDWPVWVREVRIGKFVDQDGQTFKLIPLFWQSLRSPRVSLDFRLSNFTCPVDGELHKNGADDLNDEGRSGDHIEDEISERLTLLSQR